MKRFNWTRKATAVVFLLTLSQSLQADIIYWPSEYDAVVQEKEALQKDMEAQKADYETQVAELRAEIQRLEGLLQAEKDQAASQKQELEAQLASRESELAAGEKKIAELEANIQKLEQEKAQLTQASPKQEQSLKSEIQKLQQQLEADRKANEAKLLELQKAQQTELAERDARIAELQAAAAEGEKAKASEKETAVLGAVEAVEQGQLKDSATINLDGNILFRSASSQISSDMKPILDEIAQTVLKNKDKVIFIKGHTDSNPIHSFRYRDNWQLSTERALAILTYLLNNYEVDPTRFVVMGYGEFQPAADNDTPENRAKNRRVDLMITPEK